MRSQEISWLLKEKYQGKKTKEAEKDIERLAEGDHIDYVIGFADFAGCKIDLSLRPFIPRPETEEWTLQAILEMKGTNPRVLDLCAGSGCIGTAVLKSVPEAVVHFGEKEALFLRQIRRTLRQNDIPSQRFKVFETDIFSQVKGVYDYILCNPPYIATARTHLVQPSVLSAEPKGALFGGKDGLRFIRKIAKEAKKHLASKGVLYLEFDSFQKKKIEKLFQKQYEAEFFKDRRGTWRWMRASLK